jgi:hypothetical protein
LEVPTSACRSSRRGSRRSTSRIANWIAAFASSPRRCDPGTSFDARGWTCLVSEKLGEHFAEEEALMRARGWSLIARHAESHALLHLQVQRFEHRLAVVDLTPELARWALQGIPELLRFHAIASDFGFGKFALGHAPDPGRARVPHPWRR